MRQQPTKQKLNDEVDFISNINAHPLYSGW